jgi:uncharacterized protein
MDSIWRIIVGIVCLLLVVVLYDRYGNDFKSLFLGQSSEYTVYVNRVAFSVSVADDLNERKQGLSGTQSLAQYNGKLFIFDAAAKHGIWMQDMLIPIDILWFNDRFELIHIEKNVSPQTYPFVFSPSEDARFVLELSAHSAQTLDLSLGSPLTLPTAIIPGDLKNTFQVN